MKAFDWKQILGRMIFRKKLTGPMEATAEKLIVMRKNTFKNRTGFLITVHIRLSDHIRLLSISDEVKFYL